jgi:hypothetical protein
MALSLLDRNRRASRALLFIEARARAHALRTERYPCTRASSLTDGVSVDTNCDRS